MSGTDNDNELLLDHDYDGIRELDYPLPSWWLNLFYVSIVFAALYSVYYLIGPGPSLRQELAAQMKTIELAQAKAPKPEDEMASALATAVGDTHQIHEGSEVFASKCVACHGEKAQGVIGPNLTDDYWIHGKGTPTDIAKVVTEGVADKGMPAWGQVLKAKEIVEVVAFIKSVHGSNPPGAKDPQGELQKN